MEEDFLEVGDVDDVSDLREKKRKLDSTFFTLRLTFSRNVSSHPTKLSLDRGEDQEGDGDS